ncbi:MAG: hypothetical protein HY036_01780 [Nitrospirae bacterium]|nr:hypothetical protein [Nitrospirota bacterium]MBI3351286.1 hypothetical protein [Nitrospirota bacterium]
MVTVYVILGDTNMKKSSTVRALTGVGQKKEFEIATNSGNLKVFTLISALQESEISPEKFIDFVKKGGYQNVLIPLWISGRKRGNFPSGNEYLQEFMKANWHIEHIVILGGHDLPNHTVLPDGVSAPLFISNSNQQPANRIASQIRGEWGWF